MRRYEKLKMTTINEAVFKSKKAKAGEVVFDTSSHTTPHVKKLIELISAESKIPLKTLEEAMQQEIAETLEQSKKAPLLFHTMVHNAAESAAFQLLMKSKVKIKGGPKFRNVTFQKIIDMIKIEFDQDFFPLKSHVDRKHLKRPVMDIVDEETGTKGIDTAAATPDGHFYFNRDFMQNLLDFAYVKGSKPTGAKYKSNGGPIPDEYASIEFLIFHEFMHYTNDDFYYQRVIPGSDPQIINWVGDFRTNYTLVKNGFTPPPVGLFNEKINDDRVESYTKMYDMVKDEFDKLNDGDQKIITKIVNKLSDDHGPGQQAGAKAEDEELNGEDGEKLTPKDIDDIGKENNEAIKKGTKKRESEKHDEKGRNKETKNHAQGDPEDSTEGQIGKSGTGSKKFDLSNVEPRYNWRALIKRFINTGVPKTDETYAKPHRRSSATMEVVRQSGAGAIKPAEVVSEKDDIKLMVVIDESGSMSSIIPRVMKLITTMLQSSTFKGSDIFVMKYSDSLELYKVNLQRKKAVKVKSVTDKTTKWTLTTASVLQTGKFGGTSFPNQSTQAALEAIKLGYNVFIATDSDSTYGSIFSNIKKLITANPRAVFLLFNNESSYKSFVSKLKRTTPNITYFT